MRQGKYFKENIEQLLAEIELAFRWHGPILLFSLYRSSHVLDDFESSLRAELIKLDQELVSIRVRSSSSNILKTIKETNKKNKVFSISGLGRAGDDEQADIYRSLNLHREYFIEKSIRCIFWANEEEIQALSLAAPDFWAFRHRVIDLVSERATPDRLAVFEGLCWIEWPWHIFEDNTDDALKYRKELLSELPNESETTLMRVNLCAELAGLYVRKGDWVQALDAIQRGLELLPSSAEPELEARLYLGLAVILAQMKYYSQAYAALQKAKLLTPEFPGILTLLAQVKRLEGKRSEALALVKKEIRINPDHAAAWNECGNIYADLGRNAEALDAYQKAHNFSPGLGIPLINKSAVLASTNRLDDALVIMRTLSATNDILLNNFAQKQGFEFIKKIK